MKQLLLILLLAPAVALGAFDANGVKLGDNEAAVKKVFPGIRCKPLEWKSDAADRRCDDARVALDGVPGKITVFLRGGEIQAYELRFDVKDLDRIKLALRARWGEPAAEAVETIARRDGDDRKVFKMRWEKGADRAVFTAQLDKKRVGLEVSRGTFPDEIYRVR